MLTLQHIKHTLHTMQAENEIDSEQLIMQLVTMPYGTEYIAETSESLSETKCGREHCDYINSLVGQGYTENDFQQRRKEHCEAILHWYWYWYWITEKGLSGHRKLDDPHITKDCFKTNSWRTYNIQQHSESVCTESVCPRMLSKCKDLDMRLHALSSSGSPMTIYMIGIHLYAFDWNVIWYE